MQISSDQWHVIFTAVTSIGVLLQAFALLGIMIGGRQAVKKVDELSAELHNKVFPTVASAQALLEELSPKLKVITANLVEISHTVRHQVTHIDNAVEDVVARTHHQAVRVDGMLSETLTSLNRASAAVQETVAVPIRQVNGLLNGLRAGFETLILKYSNGRSKQPDPESDFY